MFLLEANKRADKEFSVHKLTTHHTVLDSSTDITTLSQYIRNSNISVECSTRTAPMFTDPREHGWKKLNKGWLDEIIFHSVEYADESATNVQDQYAKVDLDYELYNIV